MAKVTYLSEADFDTQYRKASADQFDAAKTYYHKVKYPEGYLAEEAGIHNDEGLASTQFKADAWHGLAYFAFADMPEVETDKRIVDGIMKGGGIVETASDDLLAESKEATEPADVKDGKKSKAKADSASADKTV